MADKKLGAVLSPLIFFMVSQQLAQGSEILRQDLPTRYPALELPYQDSQDVSSCSQKSESNEREKSQI